MKQDSTKRWCPSRFEPRSSTAALRLDGVQQSGVAPTIVEQFTRREISQRSLGRGCLSLVFFLLIVVVIAGRCMFDMPFWMRMLAI